MNDGNVYVLKFYFLLSFENIFGTVGWLLIDKELNLYCSCDHQWGKTVKYWIESLWVDDWLEINEYNIDIVIFCLIYIFILFIFILVFYVINKLLTLNSY